MLLITVNVKYTVRPIGTPTTPSPLFNSLNVYATRKTLKDALPLLGPRIQKQWLADDLYLFHSFTLSNVAGLEYLTDAELVLAGLVLIE